VKRYKRPNLEGLDLGGLKGQKKRYSYSCRYFSFKARISRPVAPPEQPLPPPPLPPPKPARQKTAKAPKPKLDRHKDEYKPKPQEIEAHKREFRERR
jgi:hypothetical protein